MKINSNEIKVGMLIEYKDDLWEVLKTQHVKPGKGGAFCQVEMKSINKNTKLNERFRSNDTIEKASIENIEFNKQLLKKKEEGTLKPYEIQQFRKGFNPEIEDELIKQQEVKAAEFLAKARAETSRSIVGASLLLAAYQYRKENQDTDWFNLKDGLEQLIDTREHLL